MTLRRAREPVRAISSLLRFELSLIVQHLLASTSAPEIALGSTSHSATPSKIRG